MADGEHSGVDAVQPAGCDSAANGARAEPQLDELCQSDHAVLADRKHRDGSLSRGVWCMTSSMSSLSATPLHDAQA